MKLIGDELEVRAQIDEWTVEVMREVLEARARGPGAVVQIGSEMFEVVQGGKLRPVGEPRRSRGNAAPANPTPPRG